MSRPFEHVGIVGIGLVGGSLAAALKGTDDPPRVTGIARRDDVRAYAVEHGMVDEAVSPDSDEAAVLIGPDGADLMVLATPVDVIELWLARLGGSGYRGVVTDVASTKSGVYEAARRHLGGSATFIGGHPMAGSERSGVESARADLFRGAHYVLTPDESTDPDAYGRLHALVTGVGARVIAIRPDAHDEAVAAISHVPHVAAAALANLAAGRVDAGADVLRLAAGGFKDTTRIAAGSPDLWTGICMDNREAVVRALGEYTAQLGEFSGALAAGDVAGVRAWLARAADVRSALPAQWVPASERLTVLSIPVSDRPGVVSTVTHAAARAGCNIEDIEIDHTSEDTAVLRLVLTDEGDLDGLVAALSADGFEPDVRPLEAE